MQDNDYLLMLSDPKTSSLSESNTPILPCETALLSKNKLKKKSTKDTFNKKPHEVKTKRAKERRKFKTFTRRLWMSDEDNAIGELVAKYGIKRWTLISKKLQEKYKIQGRTGKQCRERYKYYIN
jgi:hypothetical protein